MHRIRPGLRAIWEALSPVGRVALAGVVASALVALALGAFIPSEIRRHLIAAEARGLDAAVQSLRYRLPDLTSGPLSGPEVEEADRIIDQALLDSDHVRAKVWSLDGTVLYSDVHDLIGRIFVDVRPSLAEAVTEGTKFEVTDLTEPENTFEHQYGRLIEFYVPLRDDTGRVIAVFEIYEDVGLVEEALARINVATWLAIGSGLTVLLVFLCLLVIAAVRSITRDRAAAEARAEELAVVVGAAEALASSLEPGEFLARLQERVKRALSLKRIEIQAAPPAATGVFRHRLRDRSWLVAERETAAIGAEDERILRSVANSLNAALANAALYREVRDAARTREVLLRKVVEAHEDERRILVGELHDTLAGELIRILYGIRGVLARNGSSPDETRAEIALLETLVAGAERELRAFMNRVRPVALDDVGLVPALEDALSRFAQDTHAEVGMRVRGRAETHPRESQLVVLRAGEEALLNVRKHAHARRVRVALAAGERSLRLTVDDDGIGWRDAEPPAAGRGLGLAYLRERVLGFGGVVRAERSRMGGARLVVELPRNEP